MPTSHPSILRLVPPAIRHDLLTKGLLKLHEAVATGDAARVRDGIFDLASPVLDLVDMASSPMMI